MRSEIPTLELMIIGSPAAAASIGARGPASWQMEGKTRARAESMRSRRCAPIEATEDADPGDPRLFHLGPQRSVATQRQQQPPVGGEPPCLEEHLHSLFLGQPAGVDHFVALRGWVGPDARIGR